MRNRPAEYLAHRPNFMKVAGWSFGVLFGVGLLWLVGSYGGIEWWLFLVALAALAGWLWAYCMWLACGNDFQRIASAARAREADDKLGTQ
jgi:hypothetical protein